MKHLDIRDIIKRLDGVNRSGGGWTAKCPAHDDRHASLSVGVGQDGRVLLKCHKGCSVEAIADRLGLTMQDLFQVSADNRERPYVVATYDYKDQTGNLLAQKLRYSDKHFGWRRPDGKGGWIWNRQGVPHSLYVAGELTGAVYVCEGEKDCDNLHRLGYDAASGEDGAGPGKWRKEYTELLKDSTVCVIQDNDQQGKDYAQETATALHAAGILVRVLDLCNVWPEIPEKGDASDLISHFGDEKTVELIAQLVMNTPDWTPPPPEADPFLSCFKSLDDFEEQEATWLIPGWIPEGQITLIGADGGVGKTSIWVDTVAAISSGRQCMLDPPGYKRAPQRTMFLTTEDSIRKKLKKRLRIAGADMRNIITPDFQADTEGLLRGLKFGSPEMARFIRHFRPALCVFDPVQGFIPPDVNMGSRNAMRDCMSPLIALGEETGTTFLVVVHTNKRKGAFARDRIADSADLWDISRSVLMAGYTEDQGIRYLSNEKNNYTTLQDTILFSVDDNGQVQAEGTSWKRDREYMQEAVANTSAPKRDDCKGWILQELDEAGGAMSSKDLESRAKVAGYSFTTLRRAKGDLKQAGAVKYIPTGSAKGGDRVWTIQKTGFSELPADTPTPWT